MAFALDLSARLAHEAPRLLHEQIAAAENTLQGTPDADAIHAARRHLKRARAMLRLLEAERSGPTAAVDAALRAAGRHLSESRDATVLVATIDVLLGLRPRPATANALRAWRRTLRAPDEAIIEPNALAAARDAVGQAQSLASDLAARDDSAVWAGFEASYRGGRQALRRAQTKPTAERLHTLRKALKHHLYQLRVLRPLWPAVLGRCTTRPTAPPSCSACTTTARCCANGSPTAALERRVGRASTRWPPRSRQRLPPRHSPAASCCTPNAPAATPAASRPMPSIRWRIRGSSLTRRS